MKAQWLVTRTEAGVNVTYLNLQEGKMFDCGTAVDGAMLEDIIEFAKEEGACNGDGLYLNGSLLCLIKMNGDFLGKGTYCN